MNHESHIDLNADVGERPPALREGTEEKLLSLVTSANIACGGHAGDAETMAVVLAMCKRYGVAAGAHPGFPDRANFGRIEMPMTASELAGCVFEQVRTLARIAQQQHGELQHVKPHGALYNVAVHNKR
ncbi:LamB/YcsF family protein, partial [candidate division KSB1 bacterium]|nr:LamB/YcsF family protein [candidate division KSB1 bacterium]